MTDRKSYAPDDVVRWLLRLLLAVLLVAAVTGVGYLVVLSPLKLRELLRAYFDSEIPRMYWERHGDWHNPRRRWPRREQFEAIVNEEYLCAIKTGPPARCYEAATTR
ncbi:DUF6082 family protein [Dactylosporangium sp. NPDC005572]|uniref:DUF6082 family protein n=1 Tax=Dactylosporangium sp. NPDC005572 TaxID=3156889 RepID=UPI0033BAD8EF